MYVSLYTGEELRCEIISNVHHPERGLFRMIEVRKRDRESAEGLIRRFNKRIQQSRVLAKARKSRFRLEEKSKIEKRKEAVYKVRIRKQIAKLKKLGKFDEEALKEIKRKMESA